MDAKDMGFGFCIFHPIKLQMEFCDPFYQTLVYAWQSISNELLTFCNHLASRIGDFRAISEWLCN
jgi:hypothetical protein